MLGQMSDVYTVRECDGVWTVYAGEAPFMTFAKEATAREFVTEAHRLIEHARKKDPKLNVLPWRQH